MALKGTSGTSLGAYETSGKWKKKQRAKAKRFDNYCKSKSGPVKVTTLSHDELDKIFPRSE